MTPSPRHTSPYHVAAFLRCTLAPAGVTLRDEGGRLVIVQEAWQWLQPEVDARAATIRQLWADEVGRDTDASCAPSGSDTDATVQTNSSTKGE